MGRSKKTKHRGNGGGREQNWFMTVKDRGSQNQRAGFKDTMKVPKHVLSIVKEVKGPKVFVVGTPMGRNFVQRATGLVTIAAWGIKQNRLKVEKIGGKRVI